MKKVFLAAGIALVMAGASLFWLVNPSARNSPVEKGKVMRSRVIRDKGKCSTVKVAVGALPRDARLSAKKPAVDPKWDPFKVDKERGFSLAFDDDEELEVNSTISTALREIISSIENAQASFNRKKTLASVQALLALIAKNGSSSVPAFAKRQAIEALKFCGGGIETLPEMVALATDADPEVSNDALEALQEMLWDFDTKPAQMVDALRQIVALTTDQSIIEPFVFELGALKPSFKVEAALAIIDSGNQAALQSLSDNMSFVFDDFNGEIQSREDVINYGKAHPDSSTEIIGEN